MKRQLFTIFFITITVVSFSQRRDISIKEYFADAEFFFAEEEYVDALQDYLEVYKRGYDENANINYKIGVCYLKIPGLQEKSLSFLLKASKNTSLRYTGSTLNETNAPLDVLLYLGNAYRILYELDKAVEWYNKYLEVLPELALEEKNFALKQIEASQIAGEFVRNPRRVGFTSLGRLINTNNSNHNCVVAADGNTLVFMTKLPFYEAIFMSRRRGDNWSRPINITPQLMSDGDQFVTGISNDGLTLLLTREDIFDSDIYISTFENGKWRKSKPVSKSINTRFWESHASFSYDGNTIYFTSNRNGGVGGMDIYSSTKDEKGNWGGAVNLGKNINTKYNEDTPFVTENDSSLYFSSQGHVSMGGYDFFVSHKSDSGWGGAENLQYPLCTTDDDVFYFPWNNGEIAYVHKMFEDGNGGWDIYLVDFPKGIEIEDALTEQITDDFDEETEVQIPITAKVTKLEIALSPLLFGFDKYGISPETEKMIDDIIEVLKEFPQVKLRVTGHTDALGAEQYNQKLSERRAQAVKKYIIARGVPEERIELFGMGEKQFVAKNKTESGADNPEGRKYNRRVEFELTGIDNDKITIKIISNVPAIHKINQ